MSVDLQTKTPVAQGVHERSFAWESSRSWTLVGALAIVLWATWPILSLQTQRVPPFESMALIFLVAWLVQLCLPTARSGPRSDATLMWIPAIAFALGESGSTVLFLMATHYIPAAEANLIVFLWPAITVGLGAALGIFRLQVRHVVGILLGFTGVTVLIGAGVSPSLWGIGLALTGSMAWSGYCVFRLKWRRADRSLLIRGFALCAILCAAVHGLLEHTVLPSGRNALTLTVIGIVPTGIANALWDPAFRRGDSRLLAVLSYATPLVSALLLTLFGYQPASWRLAVGAVVIVIAGILSRADSLGENPRDA